MLKDKVRRIGWSVLNMYWSGRQDANSAKTWDEVLKRDVETDGFYKQVTHNHAAQKATTWWKSWSVEIWNLQICLLVWWSDIYFWCKGIQNGTLSMLQNVMKRDKTGILRTHFLWILFILIIQERSKKMLLHFLYLAFIGIFYILGYHLACPPKASCTGKDLRKGKIRTYFS